MSHSFTPTKTGNLCYFSPVSVGVERCSDVHVEEDGEEELVLHEETVMAPKALESIEVVEVSETLLHRGS